MRILGCLGDNQIILAYNSSSFTESESDSIQSLILLKHLLLELSHLICFNPMLFNTERTASLTVKPVAENNCSENTEEAEVVGMQKIDLTTKFCLKKFYINNLESQLKNKFKKDAAYSQFNLGIKIQTFGQVKFSHWHHEITSDRIALVKVLFFILLHQKLIGAPTKHSDQTFDERRAVHISVRHEAANRRVPDEKIGPGRQRSLDGPTLWAISLVCVDIELSSVLALDGEVLIAVRIALAADTKYDEYLLRLWLRLRVFFTLVSVCAFTVLELFFLYIICSEPDANEDIFSCLNLFIVSSSSELCLATFIYWRFLLLSCLLPCPKLL
ncbi:hypothetical protein BpHYR1_019561 [Brachionus plicatilis]|uniref:Uncharacterized protein n=1 Tax=Brachionus plicatilis TaxID=10195 RepID=A0A3M7Q410_BRAPC|nr:hypothetical protein BpHYR1_019561 [Brachionus plicatilis]